jgi:hypothetical protein
LTLTALRIAPEVITIRPAATAAATFASTDSFIIPPFYVFVAPRRAILPPFRRLGKLGRELLVIKVLDLNLLKSGLFLDEPRTQSLPPKWLP